MKWQQLTYTLSLYPTLYLGCSRHTYKEGNASFHIFVYWCHTLITIILNGETN